MRQALATPRRELVSRGLWHSAYWAEHLSDRYGLGVYALSPLRMGSCGPAWSGRSRCQVVCGTGAGPRLPGGCVAGQTHAVDLSPAGPPVAAVRIWAGLDEPWRDAFRQAWEALRTGNIAVGACASTADGEIICSARNRVNDGEGPVGEIFGSALAHAEANVLARLPFGSRRDLVLTTTLQPCLQCAGAIRLGPVATVRFAGPDRYWDGCHDFGKLSAREARRAQPARIGPRRDELGTFATLISRIAHLPPGYEQTLRALGDGPMVDLVHELENGGEVERLAAMDVADGLGYLWPRLQELTKILPP